MPENAPRTSPGPNILTIDVEDWYHLNYDSMDNHQGRSFESRVRANTEKLLETLSEHRALATFFFLGCVAERAPDLVRRAQMAGHEIASHGHAHRLVHSQTRAEFHDDVKRSIDVLQAITGKAVRGYRAPSWSITKETPWAYEVLAELGLTYSASLFPFSTYLYGDSRAPLAPFLRVVNGRPLYEFPATILDWGRWRFPFGGGFYFRALPLWVTRLAARIVNRRGRSVVFYLHPREIDPDQPRLDLPLRDRWVSYVNVASTLQKLHRLLAAFPTTSIERHLEGLQQAGRIPTLQQ